MYNSANPRPKKSKVNANISTHKALTNKLFTTQKRQDKADTRTKSSVL